MTILARALLPLMLLFLSVTAGFAADRAIIVLDASGSMWGQIDGKPKLEIARETLKKVLQTIPGDMELGLIAYGHREKGSCEDIELVVPPASGTAGAITAAADAMKFLGKTPLSAAVKKAAEDLKYTEDKATVILITDGLETCNADPCALGKELEQSGVDFTAHVVGFGLTAEEGKKVACLAENTGGKYIQASDEAALEEALKVTVAPPPPAPAPAPTPAPEPTPAPAPEPAKVEFNFAPDVVMNEGGEVLMTGQTWRIAKAKPDGSAEENVTTEYDTYKGNLEPGNYVVEASRGYAKTEQKVTIEAGKTASPRFVLNAGTIVIRPRPSPGADIDSNATLRIRYPGGDGVATEYGEKTLFLPAGEQKIEVQIGEGKIEETFQLSAGQTIEKDVIVGVGRAVLNAVYSAGGEKVDSSSLAWNVLKGAKKIDGTRDSVTYGYGPDTKVDLPQGEYLVVVDMQAAKVEMPFSIKVGEYKDVSVVLNAGVLAVTAPGADGYRIFEAKKNVQGERKQVAAEFGETMQTTLVAGDYVLVTTFKADKPEKEMPFSIKAGERTELTVQ